ncbi:hypothetical protein C7999DRAFT_43636 [Corynascus novoguineensis]|uniref:Uncharacterized protein n=1 Tax=Corynascus novoguineensis TaxID=1126955 RepID=A0AAN7CPX4_9PEZI|nr:hypothetical protein C7999DRAFT_43636 [Corynascus novoguineensis]
MPFTNTNRNPRPPLPSTFASSVYSQKTNTVSGPTSQTTSRPRPTSSAFFRPTDTSNSSIYHFSSRHSSTEDVDDGLNQPGSGSGSVQDGLGKNRRSSSSFSSDSKSSSKRNQVLRVDAAIMPAGVKVGLWLMGTTPRKMEKAARHQREKRARGREEKRARRRVRRYAGKDNHGEGWEGDDAKGFRFGEGMESEGDI